MKKKHGALYFQDQSAAFHSMGPFDRMDSFDRMLSVRSNGSLLQSSSCHVIIRSNGVFLCFIRSNDLFLCDFVASLPRSVFAGVSDGLGSRCGTRKSDHG